MGDKQLSKGTQDLLLSMMKDAGLNNRQRSMLVQHASVKGELPATIAKKKSTTFQPKKPKATTHTKPSRRKTKEDIDKEISETEHYCVYELPPTKNRETEKFILQAKMENAGNSNPSPTKVSRTEVQDPFDSILAEIAERQDFLEHMRKIGKAAQYENTILSQISQKLKQLESINPARYAKLSQQLG